MPKPGQQRSASSLPDSGATELALPAAYILEIAIGEQKPLTREFAKPMIIIGREAGDLVLGDPRCSSRHAELLFDGQQVRLRDLGSTNGTWCAGQRVSELTWTPGVSLHIGSCKLTLQMVRSEDGRGLTVAMAGPPTAMVAARESPTPLLGRSLASGMRMRARRLPRWAWAMAAALCVLALVGAAAWLRRKPEQSAEPEPLMAETRESNVQFVWVSGEGASQRGGTSPARVRVGPNSSGTVSVGVAEEFAKGSGDQWRTATWLAAFNATRAMGASLASYEFNVHVGGHVDGPSAGMLTTVAMLALMRGEALRAGTTMTGTINPDGSAGPVGGILNKMRGAKEAGLTRFGFPIGTRISRDAQDDSTDLVEEARRLGLAGW